MNVDRRLRLSPSCAIYSYRYGEYSEAATLIYTEHQSDPWYHDTETEITIDERKAHEIINFLLSVYPRLEQA